MVDDTFRQQTEDNKKRFQAFTSTRELYLPGGQAPAVGSTFRNPDLADTLAEIAQKGTKAAFYRGKLAREIASAVQEPPTAPDNTLPVPPGYLTPKDLKRYRLIQQAPTAINYRGYDVYGMAPSSSGGSTVGEALNILETEDLAAMDDGEALHHYLEASALAFADRGAYVGDPAYVDVPLDDLLSDTFAKERACEIKPTVVKAKPVPGRRRDRLRRRLRQPGAHGHGGRGHREHLDHQPHGRPTSGATSRSTPSPSSRPAAPGSSCRVAASCSTTSSPTSRPDTRTATPTGSSRASGRAPRCRPTIVLQDGKPFMALGSPGGSTIITTVLQMLFNRIDREMPLPEAIAAPRASQRNTAKVTAEPAFITLYGTELTEVYEHQLIPSGDGLTSASDIGAATAIEFGDDGLLTAVAEPQRRGGGAAYVVSPTP